MLIFIAIGAFLATYIGGLVALRFKDNLHLVLGFSAGAIIAVAFFEIIPEAIELGGFVYDAGIITSLVGLGFFAYLILDRFVVLHSHDTEGHEHQNYFLHRGTMGAGSLSVHSLWMVSRSVLRSKFLRLLALLSQPPFWCMIFPTG